jgi:hypothetical protein
MYLHRQDGHRIVPLYLTGLPRPEEYKKKVAEYVKKYATEDALRETDKVPSLPFSPSCEAAPSDGHPGGRCLVLREFDV